MRKKASTFEKCAKLMKEDPEISTTDLMDKLKISKSSVYALRYRVRKEFGWHAEGHDYTPPAGGTLVVEVEDTVNHPPHYKVGGIETIDFIEAKSLDYHLGNVVKYITRAEHKGNKLQDLEKARWYLDRAINSHVDGRDLI